MAKKKAVPPSRPKKKSGEVPDWVIEAAAEANVSLESIQTQLRELNENMVSVVEAIQGLTEAVNRATPET